MLLLSSLALAAPDAPTLAATLEGQRPLIEAHGRLPLPTLDDRDWSQLAAGKVHKQRVVLSGGADRAVGVVWLPQPVEALWVGILDDVHDDLIEGLSESWLPGTMPGRKVLYQNLDLPRPFHDRHWVIVIENSKSLHERSEGKVWERTWDLDPRGTAALTEVPDGVVEAIDDALWTPANQGGWYLFPVEGGTLVVYQVRTDIGGNIPDELVLRYAMSSLDSLMAHVGDLGGKAPKHYVQGHYSVMRPDGQPIPHW